jgi:hypothetical protein
MYLILHELLPLIHLKNVDLLFLCLIFLYMSHDRFFGARSCWRKLLLGTPTTRSTGGASKHPIYPAWLWHSQFAMENGPFLIGKPIYICIGPGPSIPWLC